VFGVLGPVRVRAGESEVAITARRERTLLAALLLQPNRVVPLDQLVDAIWPAKPPRDPRGHVHGCVHRLRQLLAGAGIPGEVIVTGQGGYRAVLHPEQLDLLEFRRLVAEARAASGAGRPDQAAERYHAALALWRGPALSDVDSHLVRQAAAGLDEERLQVLEERIRADLDAGAAGELVGELTGLVRQHPHREGLHHAQMLALYRAGRQADALAAYRRARELMREELGTEPGPDLRRLHQAILNGDPALDAPPVDAASPARPEAAGGGRSPVPRQLPADVAGFTGRVGALKALDEMSSAASEGTPGPVVISAIAGTAGVGKTALAVHWAHRVVDQFPDGQLYINLRGYATETPLRPIEALSALLRSLGTPPEQIPTEETEAAALYRTTLADRQMLIVLDNARAVAQVRSLLPGSPGCVVLVTSRDRLAGLVARDGATRITLDVLTADEADALLARLLGHDRVRAEPAATAKLAEACAYLPLALRVAAELVASRPTVALAHLVAELSDRQRRLELLDCSGDPQATVRVVISWSIRYLPSDTARLFRLLGLHPGTDFDAYAAAALADTGIDHARRTLDLLTRAHLLHTTGQGRYGMHDVLRSYATTLAMDHDPDADQKVALSRLLDYYLATAAAAMDAWFPAELNRRPRVQAVAKYIPDVSDSGTAASWLDAERQCLLAVAAYTSTAGWPEVAMHLSDMLYQYLKEGHYGDSLAIHGHALRVAKMVGDSAGQASALRMLGNTHERMSRRDSALAQLREALALFQQIDDQTGQALTLGNIGDVEWKLGRFDSAILHEAQALALFRQVGDRIGEASTLTSLGNIEQILGRHEPAADHLKRSRALFHELGHTQGEAHALNSLGSAEERLGRYKSAATRFERALALFRRVGSRRGEASVLDSLGTVLIRLGDPERATEHFQQALIQFREIDEKDGESWALNGLGEAAHAAGRFGDALAHHADALATATDTGSRDQQARAHTGLGHAHFDLGNAGLARTHYEHALTLYTDLGLPDADEVRAYLYGLDTTAPGSAGSRQASPPTRQRRSGL
jgi:DNA-binding SARP family transcriptional activator